MNPISSGPPTYAESQRRYAQAEPVSIEERGDMLLSELRQERLSDSHIKALMQYVITQLPASTKSFITDSEKHRAYDVLTNTLRESLRGDFDAMARDRTATIGDLDLESVFVYANPNTFSVEQARYIGLQLLGSSKLAEFENDKSCHLSDSVFTYLSTSKCNMTVQQFLEKLNPDISDDDSSAPAKNHK